jgi:hypothetical protein
METTTAFTTDTPIETVSPRYKFISTKQIIESFPDNYNVLKTVNTKTRNPALRPFAPHSVVVRNQEWKQIDDYIPQMLIINSHNKQKPFSISLGLYRLVCSNGLVVGSTIESYRQKHIGDFNVNELIENIYNMSNRLPVVAELVERMKETKLDEQQQVDFANFAAKLRYPQTPEKLGAATVLNVRRNEDVGSNVWSVYNRIQENITRGGIVNTNGRVISSIRNIGRDTSINKHLWDKAESFLN